MLATRNYDALDLRCTGRLMARSRLRRCRFRNLHAFARQIRLNLGLDKVDLLDVALRVDFEVARVLGEDPFAQGFQGSFEMTKRFLLDFKFGIVSNHSGTRKIPFRTSSG